MNSNSKLMQAVVLSAALVAMFSGVARADDNDMSRFGGEGYSYFHEGQPVVSQGALTIRSTDPKGLTEAQYQALSNGDPEWQPGRPVIDTAQPTFRQANPHGIPFSQYQAWSSEDPEWQQPASNAPSALAGSKDVTVAKSNALPAPL